MSKLSSEMISRRLTLFMAIIIISLLFISIPWIFTSYSNYRTNERSLRLIEQIGTLADAANKVSRERGFSNAYMSSDLDKRETKRKDLNAYREVVDDSIQKSIDMLYDNGQIALAEEMEINIVPRLMIARQKVNQYSEAPEHEKEISQYNTSIDEMFDAWDRIRSQMSVYVQKSNNTSTSISKQMVMILLLSDMRDKAGRVISYIVAPVSLNEAIPSASKAKSLQTASQVRYLWNLIDTLQSKDEKTKKYEYLKGRIDQKYFNQGLGMVSKLIHESDENIPYSVDGVDLTEQMLEKFSSVIDLQKYLLNKSLDAAHKRSQHALTNLILAITLSIICMLVVGFTMLYGRRHIISPLIDARQKILHLAAKDNLSNPSNKIEDISLFSAIETLQDILHERDLLEFQLRNIANTDALTGVSNRLALDNYLEILQLHEQKLAKLCLMIIDIDNFKYINDHYGHLVGDQVIQLVANELKSAVRSSDLIIRYGGDEFLILIEEMSIDDALRIAENIRLKIQNMETLEELDHQNIVSLSIGVAVGATDWSELFKQADDALLKAKSQGKNRVNH